MRLFFLTTIIFLSISSFAQQDSITARGLKEVEISATQRPSTALSASPLQVMTERDIQKQGLHSLADAVKRFNGVVLKDYGGVGGLKTISVRGLGAEYTAMSYDGLMINNLQSGQVDISRFNLDNISILSLSIGQDDNIYQTAKAFASAGVLSLQTKRPTFNNSRHEVHSKITTGSFGYFEPMINYAYKLNDKTSLSTNINWQRTDGQYSYKEERDVDLTNRKRKNSDVNTVRTEINLYNKLTTNDDLDIKLYFFNSERGFPGAVIFRVEDDEANARIWDKNAFAQIAYNKAISQKWKFKSQAKYDYTYSKHFEYRVSNNYSRYRQNEVYWSNTLMYTILPNLSFTLSEDLNYNTLRSSFTSHDNLKSEPNRWSSFTALAAQYKTDRLTITTSGLGSYVKEEIKNKEDRDKTFKKISPTLSASYKLLNTTNLRIRGSYKHIYRIPTFTEMYYTNSSRSLDPESSSQYNLGLTWVGNIKNSPVEYLNVSLDGYYNDIDDKIIIIPYPKNPTAYNMGKVKMKGLDAKLSSNVKVVDEISVDLMGAYSYMHAYDDDEKNRNTYKGQLPYTPKHSGSASLTFNNSWVNLTYSVLFSDIRYKSAENIEDNKLKSYTDHSISVFKEMQWSKYNLYANGTIQNLLNKNYSIIDFYPMPGRSFRVSVGCKF